MEAKPKNEIENLRFVLVAPNSKIPLEKEWQTKNNYPYSEILKIVRNKMESENKRYNMAVLCGNGLVVVDIDRKGKNFESCLNAMEKLPETYTIRTGNNGRHYYFSNNEITSGTVLESGNGEIRSNNQIVLWAHSIVNGNEYAVLKNKPIVPISKKELENALKEWLKPKTPIVQEPENQNPTSIIENVLNNKRDKKLQALLNGDWEGYPSRSEAEQALVCKLNYYRLTKPQIFEIMQKHSKLGKWNEKPPQYHEITYSKALGFQAQQNQAKKEKTSEQNEYNGIKGIRKKTSFNVLEQLAHAYSIQNFEGETQTKTHYKFYTITFGTGINQKSFLICPAFETKTVGANETYLRPLNSNGKKIEFLAENPPEERVLFKICKERDLETHRLIDGASVPKNGFELLQTITEEQKERPFLFTETVGMPIEEITKISEEQWQELLNDYLNEGAIKDTIIETTFKPDLLQANPELIKPKYFMPYSNNSFLLTNSKTGKTSTAKKVCTVVDVATPSNLLGFADAQSVHEGSLHNETKKICIDEAQETKNEQAYSPLSSYMELGECENRKGKAKTIVRGYAPIQFQGNPKENQEHDLKFQEEELFQRFNTILKLISLNSEALGGRIAWFVFQLTVKPLEPNRIIPIQELEQNEAVVNAILKKAQNHFTNLYLETQIIEWLNKPLPENYSTQLKEIEEKSRLSTIREFVQGHRTLARRHVRGMALRLACTEKALQLAKEEPNKAEVLELAEEHLQDICEQNINSFSNLVNATAKASVLTEYAKAEYKNLPYHLKLMIDTVRTILTEHPTLTKIALSELKEAFPPIPQNRSQEEILRRITTNPPKQNQRMEKFGLRLLAEENLFYLLITDRKRLESIWEEKETKGGDKKNSV